MIYDRCDQPTPTGAAERVAIMRTATAQASTAVTTCESCWVNPVSSVRVTAAGRDLLCRPCAVGNYPRRVDLFPPLGIYGLTHGASR